MFLALGTILGLIGLVLIGVSGNQRRVGRKLRTRPVLRWIGILLMPMGLALAVAGSTVFHG